MKYLFYFLLTLPLFSCQNDDDNIDLAPDQVRFQVSVTDGLGSGNYEAGDTVYIYLRTLGGSEVFRGWNFNNTNINFLEDPNEWRTSFIMPSLDVSASPIIFSIPANFLKFETIQGANTPRPVYSAFSENSKGTVFIFHGTGGSAQGWTSQVDDQNYTMVKDLFAEGYGVVITESEESTLKMDLNGDATIRYQSFPVNLNTNVDYQNMEIIINTFEARGNLDRSQLYSIGMSSGGSFSGTFSFAFNTVASAIYCTSSQAIVAESTNASLLFCLMPNDEIVGDIAIVNAQNNSSILSTRDGCSDLFVNNSFPIYPEYFERIGITNSESNGVLEELINNGAVNEALFLTLTLEEIKQDLNANPGDWPTLLSLPNDVLRGISSLINLAIGGHQFYSNHNRRTIDFFNNRCN